ncbi:MAG: hypothetical protein ACLGXA_15850 [Acidobacteriota bacterium]
MNRKVYLIVGVVLVVAAFMLGFIPQHLKGRDIQSQLSAARQQLDSERKESQLDELCLLSGRVYIEAELKNYGLASQYSSKFFDLARAMNNAAPGSSRQAFLQEVLAQRDAVTGGLAKGDPGVVPEVQDMFRRALENARNELK